jgi:hypothetical protein
LLRKINLVFRIRFDSSSAGFIEELSRLNPFEFLIPENDLEQSLSKGKGKKRVEGVS